MFAYEILGKLSAVGFESGDIMFDGKKIGSFLTYGKQGTKNAAGFCKTEYRGRVINGLCILDVKATNKMALVNKLGKAIYAAHKEGRWVFKDPSPVAAPAPEPAPVYRGMSM